MAGWQAAWGWTSYTLSGVYIVHGVPESGCLDSSVYHSFGFTQSATIPGCYFYCDPAGEWIGNTTGWGSFDMTCDDDVVFNNYYSDKDCTGSILASGTMPWAFYKSNTCTSFDHQSLWGVVLAASDYPPGCSDMTTTTTTTELYRPPAPPCSDTHAGATNKNGAQCGKFDSYPFMCSFGAGYYDDDDDFTTGDMC